jgi:hypothetical protein
VINTAKSLIAYCREGDRVCPQPPLWQQLWEMLPNRRQIGVNWEPALPLILAAWGETPAMFKMLRLAEHIEWAAKHNTLPQIAVFVRGLREDDWYHLYD